jgi:hypothetical protein
MDSVKLHSSRRVDSITGRVTSADADVDSLDPGT